MANVARDILWPKDREILLQITFLWVGQGTSTIVLAVNGDDYLSMLIDINVDKKCNGIDVPSLLQDRDVWPRAARDRI